MKPNKSFSDESRRIPPRTGQYRSQKKVREDKVLLGRILAADPDYPSKTVLRDVACAIIG